ncbi:DUF551 domain-containing protein [Enterobacter roggenkampii]|uniref:DUF551 domain-containing protein n=1 Tax=Enterobacter roggenkampii TaxID=1812935 RepID=UPI002003EFD7|nr:DUF551 domain-containing protein [Enterobacter roggenkampii]MCK6840553.1 DUF551 domain-containing protein [Enterobacter roggenkampii]
MSNIDKQWLQQKIASMEAARDEIPFGLDEEDSNTLAALRIALVSIEGEPVAYIRDGFKADGVHFCGGIITAEEHERTKPALSDRYNWKHQPLYIAPPAPVSVPAAMEMDDDFDSAFEHGKAVGWNAYRAAMLQGAEPVSNRDELPDGWVACSERMPEDDDFVYIWPRPDFGVELHVAQYGKFDKRDAGWYAQVYEQNYGIEYYPVKVTHWMPLPAAPQREVK